MLLDNLKGKNIILASKSPRRNELLKGLDISFSVKTKDTDESFSSHLKQENIPLYLCKKKAEAFADELQENDVLITADTIVWVNDQVLNKPENKVEAIQMLSKLCGNSHTVYTGVCIKSKSKEVVFFDATKVHFKNLSTEEIDYYITKYQPYDKAGAYGVQEWIGYVAIDKIEGSYYNVMGLPVSKLYAELKRWF